MNILWADIKIGIWMINVIWSTLGYCADGAGELALSTDGPGELRMNRYRRVI